MVVEGQKQDEEGGAGERVDDERLTGTDRDREGLFDNDALGVRQVERIARMAIDRGAVEARAEIELMKVETFAAELEDLDRRNRRKDLEKRRIEGPRDPWRASRERAARRTCRRAPRRSRLLSTSARTQRRAAGSGSVLSAENFSLHR